MAPNLPTDQKADSGQRHPSSHTTSLSLELSVYLFCDDGKMKNPQEEARRGCVSSMRHGGESNAIPVPLSQDLRHGDFKDDESDEDEYSGMCNNDGCDCYPFCSNYEACFMLRRINLTPEIFLCIEGVLFFVFVVLATMGDLGHLPLEGLTKYLVIYAP